MLFSFIGIHPGLSFVAAADPVAAILFYSYFPILARFIRTHTRFISTHKKHLDLALGGFLPGLLIFPLSHPLTLARILQLPP